MTKKLEVYKCELCGNIVEVVHEAAGQLVCCGQKMTHLEEGAVDAATEKHVPVIKKIDGGYEVAVGDVEHPMLDAHYIEWIELVGDDIAYRKFLKPGDKPVATFMTDATKITARELCNLHGLWKGEL